MAHGKNTARANGVSSVYRPVSSKSSAGSAQPPVFADGVMPPFEDTSATRSASHGDRPGAYAAANPPAQ